jgi:hypothetical protein
LRCDHKDFQVPALGDRSAKNAYEVLVNCVDPRRIYFITPKALGKDATVSCYGPEKISLASQDAIFVKKREVCLVLMIEGGCKAFNKVFTKHLSVLDRDGCVEIVIQTSHTKVAQD